MAVALSSIGLSRPPACSMAAPRTNVRPTAARSPAAAARAHGFGRARAVDLSHGTRIAVALPAASSDSSGDEAAGEAGTAPAQTASSDSSAIAAGLILLQQLQKLFILPDTYVAPVAGFIASWAAAGSLRVASHLGVLLLLAPSLWKAWAKWRASRAAGNLNLKRRHTWVSIDVLQSPHIVSPVGPGCGAGVTAMIVSRPSINNLFALPRCFHMHVQLNALAVLRPSRGTLCKPPAVGSPTHLHALPLPACLCRRQPSRRPRPNTWK